MSVTSPPLPTPNRVGRGGSAPKVRAMPVHAVLGLTMEISYEE